ncbi:MAG: asparagine synthase (glutamine-hydrolyzing) [Planctomycetota bacterium]|nr:asparagine synthase (glutamine-hydrolyzing) [Planctomycetota bacterium]
MCGIAGAFLLDGSPVDPECLVAMTRVLEHRGPDEEGYFLNRGGDGPWVDGAPLRHLDRGGDGFVGLGHRRLSIIDLKSGQQPLCNEDGTVWIAFNGEIYNFPQLHEELKAKGHVFRTHSDTETIVHGYEEWGEDLPKRLRGMFAFAIWDERKQRMLLARDRLGMKPLYYCEDGGRFLFGSEIKAITQWPGVDRSLDLEALSDYLSLQYVPSPRSIFSSIRKLPQAHYAVVTRDGARIAPYWDLSFQPVDDATQEQQQERVVEILKDATKIRMMSEVPLGAFLSGGVDSSAIVALMSEDSDAPVKTASIAFAEEKYDESPYAKQVADLFETDHHVRRVTPDAVSIIEKLSWHYDEPFADSSAVPTFYVSQVAREKVTVALSGDGGDENFAGYRRYRIDAAEHRVRRTLPRFLGRPMFGALGKVYPKADYLPQFLRGKTFLSNVARNPADAYFFSMSTFKPHQKRALLAPSIQSQLGDYDPAQLFRDLYQRADAPDHLSRLQYIDIKTYLCDDILVKVDRASMAVSLEVRCPILDHEFMEYAARIPSGRKLKGGDGKHLLKQALLKKLPKNILYRPKMGFVIPIQHWLRNDIKDYARSVLLDSEATKTYFSRAAIEKLWNQHQSGLSNYTAELWTLMMFNLWHRRFVESPAAARVSTT